MGLMKRHMEERNIDSEIELKAMDRLLNEFGSFIDLETEVHARKVSADQANRAVVTYEKALDEYGHFDKEYEHEDKLEAQND